MRLNAALAAKAIANAPFVCREQPESPYGDAHPQGGPASDGTYRFPVPRRAKAAALATRTSAPHPYATPPPQFRETPRSVAPAVERAVLLADGMALALRAAMDRIALPLALAAAAFVRLQAWSEFGFARIEDHARERFRRSGRWLRDLAALGEASERLPALGAALTGDDGGRPIGRVAANVIARIADAGSLAEWVARARSLTVRELRDEVRRARVSDSASADPEASEGWPDAAQGSPEESQVPADAAPDDRVLVRLPVPAPVRAAFDEGLALLRAVDGREATATSFVEALVAECFAGPHPPEMAQGTGSSDGAGPDVSISDVRIAPGPAIIEAALARSTDRWRHLPASSAAAAGALKRLSLLSDAAGRGSAEDLDRQIRDLIALEDELETRLGQILADMAARGAWARLRFAGVGHYSEERLGLSRTTGEDRARASRALHRFRHLCEAYEAGRIGLEAVLLLARVLGDGPCGPARERAWVERAEEATIKRLRDEARAIGQRPCTSPISRESHAGHEPLTGHQKLPDHEPLADADWHASLRRARGETLRRIFRLGRAALGQDAPDPSTCLSTAPDVFLRLSLPGPLAADFAAAIEAQRRALETLSASIPWYEPGPDPDGPAPGPTVAPSLLAARTFSIRCRRVPSWVGLLALLEDFAATWDAVDGSDLRPQDAVFVRDGWRCTAPGCTSRRNLEDHHIVYRSRGGSDEVSNRSTLCRFHHQRGEHGGLASCRGEAPVEIVWHLGREGLGGRYMNERRLPWLAKPGTHPAEDAHESLT
jgi:hypothetical protein